MNIGIGVTISKCKINLTKNFIKKSYIGLMVSQRQMKEIITLNDYENVTLLYYQILQLMIKFLNGDNIPGWKIIDNNGTVWDEREETFNHPVKELIYNFSLPAFELLSNNAINYYIYTITFNYKGRTITKVINITETQYLEIDFSEFSFTSYQIIIISSTIFILALIGIVITVYKMFKEIKKKDKKIKEKQKKIV